MKVIFDDKILSVSLVAGTQDPEYPVENVQNEYPRKPFRATSQSATIRIAESGDAEAIAMFSTNADSVTVIVAVGVSVVFGIDENGETVESGYDETGATIVLTDRGEQPETIEHTYTKENENNGVIWIPLSPHGMQRTLDIVCEVFEGNVEIGVLAAGEVLHFRDMERESYQNSPRDFSIEQELQSGNPYYVDLGRARVIPFYVFMWGSDGNDPAGYNTWREFYYKYLFPFGRKPKAWLLSERLDPAHYAVWGRVEEMPKTVMRGSHMLVSTTIREIN